MHSMLGDYTVALQVWMLFGPAFRGFFVDDFLQPSSPPAEHSRAVWQRNPLLIAMLIASCLASLPTAPLQSIHPLNPHRPKFLFTSKIAMSHITLYYYSGEACICALHAFLACSVGGGEMCSPVFAPVLVGGVKCALRFVRHCLGRGVGICSLARRASCSLVEVPRATLHHVACLLASPTPQARVFCLSD